MRSGILGAITLWWTRTMLRIVQPWPSRWGLDRKQWTQQSFIQAEGKIGRPYSTQGLWALLRSHHHGSSTNRLGSGGASPSMPGIKHLDQVRIRFAFRLGRVENV